MVALGYRPNRAARQLRTRRVETIGLIVPSVANPFWGAFAGHLEAEALGSGLHVLLCNSERDPGRERRYVEELYSDGIRGIILCTSLPSLDYLSGVLADDLCLVAFDRTAQAGDPDSVVNISLDNVVGAALATRHLLELGHRRLAFVSGSTASVNRRERLRGFLDAIEDAGLSRDDAVVWVGTGRDYADLDAAGVGRLAAIELLGGPERARPTGIPAMNDICALVVCAGVRDVGLTVGVEVQ